jgi:hypothetical protein
LLGWSCKIETVDRAENRGWPNCESHLLYNQV